MEQSPTGKPLLSPKAVPYLIAAVAVAELLALSLPQHTLGAKIAHGIVALGAMFGIASPGVRRLVVSPPTDTDAPGIKGLVKPEDV